MGGRCRYITRPLITQHARYLPFASAADSDPAGLKMENYLLLLAAGVADIVHARSLPASLKDDTARMNDRNKHKVTGQMNHQTADPKANASVFLFFPTAHFLKTILASRTNGTFGFARHTSRPFAKPKEPFFAHARLKTINSKIIN